MLYIVPAAGKGQRFIDAGYDRRKPFLKMENDLCLADVVLRKADFVAGCERILILPEDHGTEYLNTICTVVKIKPTCGTSATLAFALLEKTRTHEFLEQEVLVSNVDNIVDYDYEAFAQACRASGKSCGVIVFESPWHEEPIYSYVNKYPHFTEVGEKLDPGHQRLAIAGVYWFRTVRELLMAIEAQQYAIEDLQEQDDQSNFIYDSMGGRRQVRHNGEPYLSLALNMFRTGGHAVLVRPGDVRILGTPEQYEAYRRTIPGL